MEEKLFILAPVSKKLLILVVVNIFFNPLVSLATLANDIKELKNGKILFNGTIEFDKCKCSFCKEKESVIRNTCNSNKWGENHGIPMLENRKNNKLCVCLCTNIGICTLSTEIQYKITLLKQISLVFQQAKSLRRQITTLRKNIKTLDLDTLKTMLTDMKQDFKEIQAVTNNQVSTEGWQEIYEYIDNVIKINPAVDNKSYIHQQVETTLKLIKPTSASIPNLLAQLEAQIYLETHEMLNQASETERKYFLPQLEAIHNANQKLINH
ncbi:hypothetical protein QUF74_03590 [Candidatus Halobeggiatoa sp. HSG11]|nr:hypothetical protein [Candidatus Halobeggiatoa sp. HSG11]